MLNTNICLVPYFRKWFKVFGLNVGGRQLVIIVKTRQPGPQSLAAHLENYFF